MLIEYPLFDDNKNKYFTQGHIDSFYESNMLRTTLRKNKFQKSSLNWNKLLIGNWKKLNVKKIFLIK